MRSSLLWWVLLLMPCFAAGNPPQVLVQRDFETDPGTVFTMDRQATLGVCRDEGVAFTGKGALRLVYTQRPFPQTQGVPDLPGSVLMPVMPVQPKLGAISFALRTTFAGPFACILGEGDNGPRYTAMLWSQANQWQPFTLRLKDFIFDRDGPADPDGKLDPERVAALILVDLRAMLEQSGEANTLFYMEPSGEQTLLLDDLKLTEAVPEATPAVPAPMVSYGLPVKGMAFVGGLNVKLTEDADDAGEPVLKVEYQVPTRTLFAVAYALKPGALSGAGAIQIRLRSSGRATFIVGLEEQRNPGDKSSYNTSFTLSGLDGWQTVTLPLSQFKLDANRADPDGRLDPEQVGMLILGDLSAMAQQMDLRNVLWLDWLTAVPEKPAP
jgi:hypothetical protein